MISILSAQLELMSKLDKWVVAFTKESMSTIHRFEPNDIFIDLNSDITESLVLHKNRPIFMPTRSYSRPSSIFCDAPHRIACNIGNKNFELNHH